MTSNTINSPVRGDAMANGWYVGTSRSGVIWVCYSKSDFAAMCERFDRNFK